MKRFIVIILCGMTLLFNNAYLTASKKNIKKQDSINQHHVVCSFAVQPQTKKDRARLNEAVHSATYELKQYFKKNYSNSITKNNLYPHRQDSVFFC